MPKPTPVRVRREPVVLPTYLPLAADRNPMFLEKRVYQGSSGRVYPLPCTDRIAERPVPRAWDAVFLENGLVQVMILPELGGRIHRVLDLTNGYDAVYHQPVIKPALVGLAGPWASGGIEFNWPQHHRPSTFRPADVAIERGAGGAATVWLSEHDPMARMKGMHGVRLHPGSSRVEIAVRAYNRTADVQTFLWWANTAARVHEHYQSFFPPDVAHVADHARRAMSAFPLCRGRYYGVDYAGRARRGVPPAEAPRLFRPPRGRADSGPAYAPNDLSWYANIPVPTSYMCVGSSGDFSGGYDFRAGAGLVQVNNHHIAPGKKQWTWGNQEFGYAWDRNLTDPEVPGGECGPYVELMVGVYTDNQPDFSFLQPGETKTWTQTLYPYRGIGPAQAANAEAAASLRRVGRTIQVGIAATAEHRGAQVRLLRRGRPVARWTASLAPHRPFVAAWPAPRGASAADFTLRADTRDGRELVALAPPPPPGPAAPPATEPPEPSQVKTVDDLFLIGLHLEQYRHATRRAEDYWREGLRRDSGDVRCHLALGRWHLRRGTLAEAERHLRASLARLTARNANPYDGEASYQLGRCLQQRALAAGLAPDLLDQAYAAFYKATWNQAWQPAGHHALAEIAALRKDWAGADEHLERALRGNADNLCARDLRVIVLRQLGRTEAAAALLAETLRLDPLDWWARHLRGDPLACDTQVRLDLTLDCARAGLFGAALAILAEPPRRAGEGLEDGSLGAGPLVHYYRAWLHGLAGRKGAARRQLAAAARANPDYCFPARLEEIAILEWAMAANPRDVRAPFFLGNLLYDRCRHAEAMALWERAVRGEPGNSVAWRNLGIGYFNLARRPAAARRAYRRARQAEPADPRLLYEEDQLRKRLGDSPRARLRALQGALPLVRARDDLSLELCALYNQTGAPAKAGAIVSRRRFQPWEGGEGEALGQHARTHLALGRRAYGRGDAESAAAHFRAALSAPPNLGEAWHLLVNRSRLEYWLGLALAAQGADAEARRHWRAAAHFKGDFQSMRVRAYSEMTYYSALAARRLGRGQAARRLLRALRDHARRLASAPATIDYFATSLPTMLLFDDDPARRQRITAWVLEAQACLGLGEEAAGRRLLRQVLRQDPSHALAADLLAEREIRVAPPRRSGGAPHRSASL